MFRVCVETAVSQLFFLKKEEMAEEEGEEADDFLFDYVAPAILAHLSRETRPRKRRKSVISRDHLPLPCESVMFSLVHSAANDATYRFLFRMRKKYFERLLVNFTKPWKRFGLSRDASGAFVKCSRDRDRQIDARMALALTLRFLFTTSECSTTSVNYGMILSTYSRYLRHGLFCLQRTLQDCEPLSSYAIPSFDDRCLYAHVIEAVSDGKIKNVWGAVDGICLSLERPGDTYLEGDNFCAYKKGHKKRLCAIFAPDGSINGATWGNGNVGDSTLFFPLASKLELERREIGKTLRVLGDSAFAHSKICIQCVHKNAEAERVPVQSLRQIRNFSEIGLGMMMKSTRHLYIRLPADDKQMIDLTLDVALRLLNFRVRVAREGQLLGMHDTYFAEAEAALGRVRQ